MMANLEKGKALMAKEETKILISNGETNMLHESHPKSIPMNGGESPYSYAQHSFYQREMAEAAKNAITEAITEKLDIQNPSSESPQPFRIADLGCSIGPNTFISVQNIVEAVELKYQNCIQEDQHNPKPLEFEVLFNDHAENDFNTLFRSLPLSRRYFAGGVPGSFHGRLFPRSSLHFVNSFSALHWLSKVPAEVVDSNSAAFNRANIYCSGAVKEVTEAFSAQHKEDMEGFLSARAEELVKGGLMALNLVGLPDGVILAETATGMGFDLLDSCLVDMAKMGLISEAKVESFNLPIYYPPAKELMAVVEANDHCFRVERFDILSYPLKHAPADVQMVVSHTRAALEGLIMNHFGNEILEKLFNSYGKKLEENYFIFDQKNRKDVDFFILLKRK
ncbi:loganic acid O-methyltransferase-like [Malania oleifera]|uniref:loganic acid O-methyltransferase-like n=1 Tax=Malania oleifera TaxID=397392 RepID=UPI0025AE2CC2|nr:loganic acid O-methyltransferase-like [Malania oleifera]